MFRHNPIALQNCKTAVVVAMIVGTVFVPLTSFAKSKCSIETKTTSKIEGKIEGVRNLTSRSQPHTGKYRICVAEMDVKVKGTWQSTKATYLFGPDMTENDACERATAVAKLEVLKTKVPEKLASSQLMECYEGDRRESKTTSKSPINSPKTVPKMTNKEWNGYKRINDFGRLPWLK
jgi:hypothetical protein